MSEKTPLISVVTATYNRSNVLRYAIESVRASTLTDWEHLVIGDCCTDDTAEVVASFQEPRLRFTNLPNNIGEQSGPNNVGWEMARGKYIAFLNHDDLYLPPHLERAVKVLDEGKIDLVYELGLASGRRRGMRLAGAAPPGQWMPHIIVPATLWVMRRELLQEVGGWRFYRELHTVPSQDWLTRAWKRKKKIRMNPQVGALIIPSRGRLNVYANREEHEQAAAWERIQRGDSFHAELTAIACAQTAAARGADLRVMELLQRAGLNAYYRTLYRMGVSPLELNYRIAYGGKGAFIDRLRKSRGLPRKE